MFFGEKYSIYRLMWVLKDESIGAAILLFFDYGHFVHGNLGCKVLALCGYLVYLVYDVHAFDDLAEGGESPVVGIATTLKVQLRLGTYAD